jgi:hypothetical protein
VLVLVAAAPLLDEDELLTVHWAPPELDDEELDELEEEELEDDVSVQVPCAYWRTHCPWFETDGFAGTAAEQLLRAIVETTEPWLPLLVELLPLCTGLPWTWPLFPLPPFAAAELMPPTIKKEITMPNASTTAAATGATEDLFTRITSPPGYLVEQLYIAAHECTLPHVRYQVRTFGPLRYSSTSRRVRATRSFT